MVQVYSPLMIRRLKTSFDFDQQQPTFRQPNFYRKTVVSPGAPPTSSSSSSSSRLSYHRPTITSLSYKTAIANESPILSFNRSHTFVNRSGNNSPALMRPSRNSTAVPVMCKRFKKTVTPDMLPPLSDFGYDSIHSRSAKKKILIRTKQPDYESILTLKALGIKKIAGEKDSVHSKSMMSSESDINFKEKSVEREEEFEEFESPVDYLFMNDNRIAEEEEESTLIQNGLERLHDSNGRKKSTTLNVRRNSIGNKNGINGRRPSMSPQKTRKSQASIDYTAAGGVNNNPTGSGYDYTPIYVNNEIINKPRTHHIIAMLSCDAQYAMIKVYEDLMRRRLACLYSPHRMNTAPTISADAFYNQINSETMQAMMADLTQSERNELIEKKIKRMSGIVEEGVRLLDIIDEYVTDKSKFNGFSNAQDTSNLFSNRRASISSRKSSIISLTSSKMVAPRHNDPLTMFTKWVNSWNKEYTN